MRAQAETFTCVCTRPLAGRARGRGGDGGGLLSLCHHAPRQGPRSLRILHSNLAFQVVMKVCLSREENRTYFISHFVSLIYNLQIFRHMVCEPPSVLLLGPTNPCHLLPTLNTKCLLSPSSALSPGHSGSEGTIPAPGHDHLHGIKLQAPKTVKSTGSTVSA